MILILVISVTESWQIKIGYGSKRSKSSKADKLDTIPCAYLDIFTLDIIGLTTDSRVLIFAPDFKQGTYAEYTICSWSKGQNEVIRLLSDRYDGDPAEEIEVSMSVEAGGVIRLAGQGDSANNIVDITPPTTIDVQAEWVHACVAVDTTTSPGTATVYWYLRNTGDTLTNQENLPASLDAAIQISYANDEDLAAIIFKPGTQFAMHNNLKIYDKALSQSELEDILVSCMQCGNVYCGREAQHFLIEGLIFGTLPSLCLTAVDLEEQCVNPASALSLKNIVTPTSPRYGNHRPQPGYGNRNRRRKNNGFRRAGYGRSNNG